MEEPWWEPSRIERQLPDEAELAAQQADVERIAREQREYESAVRIARYLNGTTWVALLGTLGGRALAWLLTPIAVALPLVAFAVAYWKRPHVRLDGGPADVANLAYTLCWGSLLAVLLAIRAPLLELPPAVWVGSACCGFAFPAICWFIDRSMGRLSMAAVMLVGAGYGYGVVVAANVVFDGLASRVVHAPIVGKKQGRSKRWRVIRYLQVAVPDAAVTDVHVSAVDYQACKLGQRMVLRVHPGALSARWYEVKRTCVGDQTHGQRMTRRKPVDPRASLRSTTSGVMAGPMLGRTMFGMITATSTARTTDAADFVGRFQAFWKAPHSVPLSTILAPDVRIAQPLTRATRGLSAAEAWRRRLFIAMPSLRAEVEGWSASGDLLFIEIRMRAVEPTFRLEWPAVDRFRLRAGLATERITYFDGLMLLRQVARQPRTWLRFVRWARSEWQGTRATGTTAWA
jgi:hypothetical protein